MSEEDYRIYVEQKIARMKVEEEKLAARRQQKTTNEDLYVAAIPPNKQTKELDRNVLPNREGLALHANFVQFQMETSRNDPGNREFLTDTLTDDIMAVWHRCGLETHEKNMVKKKIKRFLDERHAQHTAPVPSKLSS